MATMPASNITLPTLLLGVLAVTSGCVTTWGPGTGPYDGHHHPGPHMHDWDSEAEHENAEGVFPYEGNEAVTLEVAAGRPSELRFSPDSFEVPAGARVGVVFTNEGEVEHELAIEVADFHIHADPGRTTRATFVAPEAPGEYTIGCYLPGHFEQGMRGTLVVA